MIMKNKLQVTSYKLQAKAGFTLIETLVATFVLVTAIVGPLSIVAKGVFFSNIAKDQITASYLAQEAIEYLRNKRDNNTIAQGTWAGYKGLIDSCITSICKIDVYDDTLTNCGESCPPLKYSDAIGLYGYGSGGDWTQTPYTRSIKVYYVPTGESNEAESNQIKIEVTMTWTNGALSKNFKLKENLLNWQ